MLEFPASDPYYVGQKAKVFLWLSLKALGYIHFAIAITYVAVSLGKIYTQRRREKQSEEALAVAHKCRQPLKLSYKWPLAFDLLLEAFSADREGNILAFFVSLVERTGVNFEQTILGVRSIDTVDPRNLEAVLSSQFKEFELGARKATFRPLLGHGIFTQDGDAWKVSRDLLRPQFMHTRTESFPAIQKAIEKFITSLKTSTERVLDLQPLFFRLTMDTTMAVLFGRFQDSSSDQARASETAFARAFDYAQHVLAQRGRLGDLYWLIDGLAFRRSCRAVHSYIDKIVADSLAETASPHASETSKEPYVFLKALTRNTRDPEVLRDQCINVLLAGRDTTACLLSWTLTLLASHPKVQEQLRDESCRIPSYSHGELPTPSELKSMRMLDNVLKEVLRLYPSVPINSRAALKTTTLPVGGGPDGLSPILVHAGEAVGYCVYAMHRRKDLYGDDAAHFRPARWNELSMRELGMGYLPFNGGPRVCPGQEFALLEAGYTIVRLLQTFDRIERTVEMGAPERQTVTLVVANADGCKVQLF